jgi:SAM-dependent methyltransferase
VTTPQRNWDERYQTGELPWDSGIRDRELARVLREENIAPGRASDLGCGTGTNAVFLAEQNFDVTAFDLSPTAIDMAKRKAEAANVNVNFRVADLVHFDLDVEPFDFVFDRGCYHCARDAGLTGYQETLKKLTRPGTRYLVLTGNANEQTEGQGPPRLTETQIRDELSGLFEIQFLREMRFEDAGGVDGPLGWSCLMTRR